MAETEVLETETKKIKAKDASLWAKIVGSAILIGGSVLKWCGLLQNASIQEIALVAYGVMGMFSTVDINLMLEKFSGGKQ